MALSGVICRPNKSRAPSWRGFFFSCGAAAPLFDLAENLRLEPVAAAPGGTIFEIYLLGPSTLLSTIIRASLKASAARSRLAA